MARIIPFLIFTMVLGPLTASAQQSAWVQIEAQPSLTQARDSIRGYARSIEDVNGFSLGNGWYAIALGPYAPEEAAAILRNLRGAGLIPPDSFVAQNSDYRQQFWPVGTDLLNRPTLPVPEADTAAAPDTDAASREQQPAEETPREARASEAALPREARAELQTALKWAGFYDGAIDAAFGAGTRGAMARWQEAYGYAPTGVLTTGQRAELLRRYNAVLEQLDLRLVRDEGAGIEIKIPAGAVAFEKYAPPFAHYSATGDLDARVLLISQAGDRATLSGLFDIMQTLEIVPPDGPRTLADDSFTLIGENAYVVSHSQAWLRDGTIKGFTLVWPSGDEERRTRLLGEMQASFARLDGVLDPDAGSGQAQSIDLVAGLEIRRPKLSRSGFYVDASGTVVTTAQVLDACGRVTIDDEFEAEIAMLDENLGIAVLRPVVPLAPVSVAAFLQSEPRLQSDVAVAGYSYGGVLGAPTLTFGRLADLRGLDGETRLSRLALNALDGDAGGPVVDAGGAVLGMLLPAPRDGRVLPDGVSFAADAEAVRAVLEQAGITPAGTAGGDVLPPETLTDRAAGMTVLVSCWD